MTRLCKYMNHQIDFDLVLSNLYWHAECCSYKIYFEYHHLLSIDTYLLTKCLELLDLNVTIEFKAEIFSIEKTSMYVAKNEINPKKSIESAGLFKPSAYTQVFGSNFVSNLSIIDLIF